MQWGIAVNPTMLPVLATCIACALQSAQSTLGIDLFFKEPTSTLSETARDWCKSLGSTATTVEDILHKPDRRVLAAIQVGTTQVGSSTKQLGLGGIYVHYGKVTIKVDTALCICGLEKYVSKTIYKRYCSIL